ncbi:MAG TPA: sulfotransferase [Povalibacter sp.]|nr:sulfotransferase [Povalibacter sp.]
MRLPKPFYRLPLRFDVARLREEVASLDAAAWAKHPNDIRGNTSARLISVDGGENDDVNGVMRITPHLQQLQYVRQILASFGVVWSRSRLLRLAPGATVPEHADINYHWFNRVRLHIPIVTRPEVRFYCGDQSVHMAAGEAWVFDNWRLHRVENFTPDERIHLVADTSGSAAFWQLVAQGEADPQGVRDVPFMPDRDLAPLTERTQLASVMPPAEVDLLVMNLREEVIALQDSPQTRMQLARYRGVLDSLCRDWRQLYALYGSESAGWGEFTKLRDAARAASRSLGEGLAMRTNRVDAHTVLEARVLRTMLSLPRDSSPAVVRGRDSQSPRLRAPVFIVAAPRSGSTLLFETLAASSQLCTVGGEAHWLVETIPELTPGAGTVDSNRLTAEHATPAIAQRIVRQIAEQLRDAHGKPVALDAATFLEKTPKNTLRVPFFDRIFPDARFIFLWRDPRENIASIIEAWRSGAWKTYNNLDGFAGPWSLLLPPGWREMNGKPLEEIAAWQWQRTNGMVLDDLQALPAQRWMAVNYGDLVRAPRDTVQQLCRFLNLEMDASLEQRLRSPLPHSRYTLTAPQLDKWRAHESRIMQVLPSVEPVWQRLQRL